MGHWGQRLTRKRINDPSITDRMISQFIRQCPCCQVMSRIYLQIKTHPFTCASYNPFEVLHLDHIGPLRPDAKGHMFILVIIDAFSRCGWNSIPLWQQRRSTQRRAFSTLWSLRNTRGDPHGSRNSIPQRSRRGTAANDRRRTIVDNGLFKWGEWHRGASESRSASAPQCYPIWLTSPRQMVVRAIANGVVDNEHHRVNLYRGNSSSTYFKQLDPVI